MENKTHLMMGQPIQIGQMTVKNRIVFPPMNTNLTSAEGYVTPELEEYYLRRAKGGAGMIILEAASVNGSTKNHPGQPVFYDRKHVASWANLVERLHRYDVKVSIELVHYGSEASIPPRESPSAVSKYREDPGSVLGVERIREIQEEFAYSAWLAQKAGMDAVTLHATHGYLIAEFLSNAFNHRKDQYGGSFENRCRFLLETIDCCREKVGNRFPIMVRFSADEFLRGGRGIEESVELAKVLEAHGAAAIDISASQPSAYLMTTPPYCLPQGKGLLVPYSAAIKQAVRIPVFTAIGIRDPEQIEDILSGGKADLVVLGRPQLADPDYVNKVLSGRADTIRHCLSCEYCLDTLDDDRAIRCAVNPETGRELEFTRIEKSACQKRVVIVGGGPAGMEAARVAKLRGHEVILLEKQRELGGTLNAAKIPPHKDMIGRLVKWYQQQLPVLGVDIRTGTEATEAMLTELRPDVVFLAAGAYYIRQIAGSESEKVMDAVWALTHPEQVGRRIVIVGGGASGAEVADYFSGSGTAVNVIGSDGVGGDLVFRTEINCAANGREIAVVEMLDSICSDLDVFCKEVVLTKLRENGVRLYSGCRVDEINASGVRAFRMEEQQEIFLPADTVILAGGLRSKYAEKFTSAPCPVIRLGDSIRAGKIKDAIYTAYYHAKEI